MSSDLSTAVIVHMKSAGFSPSCCCQFRDNVSWTSTKGDGKVKAEKVRFKTNDARVIEEVAGGAGGAGGAQGTVAIQGAIRKP
ncbi:hypothetical protein ABPG75_009989 [Micractinium tetrahymenae]